MIIQPNRLLRKKEENDIERDRSLSMRARMRNKPNYVRECRLYGQPEEKKRERESSVSIERNNSVYRAIFTQFDFTHDIAPRLSSRISRR